MTCINANISSIVAQNILGRLNVGLEQELSGSSTGLLIDTDKDDPADLIASDDRRDIATAECAMDHNLVTECSNADAWIAEYQFEIERR